VVDFLGALEGDFTPGILLFGNARSELLIETLDLVKLRGTSILANTLLVADLVRFGN